MPKQTKQETRCMTTTKNQHSRTDGTVGVAGHGDSKSIPRFSRMHSLKLWWDVLRYALIDPVPHMEALWAYYDKFDRRRL